MKINSLVFCEDTEGSITSPFLLVELKSLSIECLSLFVEQLVQRIICVNRCFTDNLFIKKKTPTSTGERCWSEKHTMRKLHGANLSVFFYIFKN